MKEKTTAGVCGGGGLRAAEESREAAFHARAACQISEAALAQIMAWRDYSKAGYQHQEQTRMNRNNPKQQICPGCISIFIFKNGKKKQKNCHKNDNKMFKYYIFQTLTASALDRLLTFPNNWNNVHVLSLSAQEMDSKQAVRGQILGCLSAREPAQTGILCRPQF